MLLDQQYVCRTFEAFESVRSGYSSSVTLVMEIGEGGDLYSQVEKAGRFTEEQSKHLVKRMLTIVHYLHNDVRITHRDIKLENWVFDKPMANGGVLKLIDFGYS